MAEAVLHSGSCHCGQIRFEATTDLARVIACNCSICSKHGLLLTFVPADEFRLLAGVDDLVEYRFNTGKIQHQFCRRCGVETFGRGKGKDGSLMVALNVRCLDAVDVATLDAIPFDGRSM